MSWVLLDDDFPNHPKAAKAGPAAAYLFVCGLCYCRKYHTNGFIPANAVKGLGVAMNPRKMIDALISVGLWDHADGGFQVHGYAETYNDEQAKAKKEKRREAGRLGGLASSKMRSKAASNDVANAQASATANPALVLEPYRDGYGTVPASSSSSEKKGDDRRDAEAPIAAWLADVLKVYPRNRVTSGYMTENLFWQVFANDPRPAADVWAEFQANLAANIRSHEWRVRGFVPKLENYLRAGAWKQVHDEIPLSARVNERTARTLASAAAFASGGDE